MAKASIAPVCCSASPGSSMTSRTVFICRDLLAGSLVDAVASLLQQQGIEVIRGPMPSPGTKLIYAPETHRALFGRAEVMMFSGGSVGSREVMLAAPKLRGIVNPAIGLDTVDLDAANELDIIVAHGATPENYLGIAEATVMLMLVLSLQLPPAERALQQNLRPPQQRTCMRALRGRTIGLIGFGRIARAVAERLRAFEVELLAYHPRLTQAQMPAGVTLVELDTLLARSDMVSLHAALNESSRGMIGKRELGLMKRDAYLLNTACGEVVDESALYWALRNKRIAGAALDVFHEEPLPMDSPLRTLDNVVLTPHMVGKVREGFDSQVTAAVENISRILAGELPLYCKNPEIARRWRERLGQSEKLERRAEKRSNRQTLLR